MADLRQVPEMKLETAPETSRAASGVVGVKMIITEVANYGERGEKGGERFEDFKIMLSLYIQRFLQD